jgi:Cu2+-exporting ATPase
MSGCCPTDVVPLDAAIDAARAGDWAASAREVRPGVGFVQAIAPGMHCGACVATLERGLKREPGVLRARANLTAKRLSLEYDAAVTDPARLAAAAARLGYSVHPADDTAAAEAAEARETRDLVMRMGVAGFAAMNVMLLSVSVWSGAEGATRDLMHWISAVIALPVVVYAGRPFFQGALAGLRAGRLNMDAPISLAVILASSISLSETIRGGHHAYFDAAVTLLFLLLVGRYLDRLMRARARSAAAGLMRLQPKGALVLREGGPTWTPLAEIAPADRVLCAPGERIAVDGVVEEGASDLDLGWLTGESAPERVVPGMAARAGSLNLSGALTIRATAAAQNSTVAEIAALMAEAESRKSRVARLADRAAALYSPVVHTVAAATFAFWLWQGLSTREAGMIAVALLIITCPCALGLAAPMAQATAAGALFRRGIMLKDGAALERLATVRHAVFDKTGTLTTGKPRLRAGGDDAALAMAAALGARSRHPLAQALAEAARARGLAAPTATDVVEHPGDGVAGLADGRPAQLGRGGWVGAPHDEDEATTVWLRIGDAAPVAFRFEDAPRPGASETIAALSAAGLSVEVLSGDRPAPVAALARRLGVARWRAEARPDDKIEHVAALSAAGGALMVGDGLNDAPALAAATVSMAPASAADVGRAAADLVFLGDDLRAVAEARDVAVRTRAIILQNFAIAAGYNLIAVPLGAMGYASPLVAAVAMSASSLVVVANALRLNRAPRVAPAPRAAMTEALA